MSLEVVLIAVVLLAINILFAYRPIPIMGFPVTLFTIYLYATQLIYDVSLPYNPYFSIFSIFVAVASLILNASELKN